MNNVKTEIDDTAVQKLLDILDDDDVKKDVIFAGLKAGGKVLQEAGQSSFKNKMGSAAGHYSRYIKKPFYEGIKLITDKAYNEVVVSIMSDYRMRFYENQIQQRFTKKGYNRGVVTANHFFRTARDNSDSQIEAALLNGVDKQLKKHGL